MSAMESQPRVPEATSSDILVRPLREPDLPAADHIMRLAFGTFLGLPEPTSFLGDAGYVRTRWLAAPTAAFAAEVGGEVVGSNFATQWGSVGFFGPLTVHPAHWERQIASRLMEPILACFDQWGTTHAGLFTFAHSPKHLYLYQKFDFWPRFLTAIMAKLVAPPQREVAWSTYSEVPPPEQAGCLSACRELTDAIYAGLDLGEEIRAVAAQGLGDTVLLWDQAQLVGLAVCHCGAGTEAGSGTCYVKFGAVGPGATASARFDQLLDACEALAARQGLARLSAGVNTGRHAAYRQMLARGFRTELQGVAMHHRNAEGYNRPEVYLMDDWR